MFGSPPIDSHLLRSRGLRGSLPSPPTVVLRSKLSKPFTSLAHTIAKTIFLLCLSRKKAEIRSRWDSNQRHFFVGYNIALTTDLLVTELIGNNGPSESGSAKGSTAVRASTQASEPTVVRRNGADDSAAERGSQQGVELTAAARQNSAAAATVGGGA